MADYKVYLSVGHGGQGDPGAVSSFDGKSYKEHDECEKIVKRAIEILAAQGVNVGLIPLRMTLRSRTRWMNQNIRGDKLCVEAHMNAGPATAHGAEIFYFRGNSYMQGVAEKLLKAYCKAIKITSRGVKPDTQTRFGRLGFIADTTPPALLVELGFISNKAELEEMRVRSSLGLANLVLSWLNLPLLTEYGSMPEKQVVSEWAHSAVLKMKEKGFMTDWSTPQNEVEAWRLAHILHKMGAISSPDGVLTYERLAVAFDNLKLL